MAKTDRSIVLRDFYTNRLSANKSVAVNYLEIEIDDFFNRYPFDSKNIKDYDKKKMRKHIVFDLCRILGDSGYRLFELFTDYVNDVYNREEYKSCIDSIFKNLKLNSVN